MKELSLHEPFFEYPFIISIFATPQVPETLKYLGISESLQAGAGALGAATLTNTLLTPVHVVMLPYMIPTMANLFKGVQEKRELMKNITDKFK